LFRSVQKEQLKVPARIEYLGELRDFVTKVGHRHGFSERVINAFKLSIDEAATNIIKHAYRDWPGNITIRAIVKKNSLAILLIDQGKYFDPRQVSDPDLQRYVDIGKKGGLGIFIMRRLLDEIDYRKTEEGNELLMVKHRDVARKRRIVVPSISMTLKARYWLIATGIFTGFLIGIYSYYYFRRDDNIIQDYLGRGRAALSMLASDLSTNMRQQLPESALNSLAEATNSSEDIEILTPAQRAINYLRMSEYRDILYSAIIVDNNNVILAGTDSTQVLEKFILPQEMTELQKDVSLYRLRGDDRVLDIAYPVLDDRNRILCRAHFLISYESVSREILRARLIDLNMAGIAWLLGAAGLFLLIYLVMNPFRRLSEWVKQLGQPGVADEMDIDASTEIGEIAQAFSDITLKLRESQVNLAEQERLQKEMQVAQEIQQTLLPSEFPELEGYELDSYYAAAKEVGGDYYDFVEVDKDTLGIVVADVSGKGVPGSLVMTMIRTALRTEARGIKDAAEVLARVNEFVVNDMKKGMFVTLFYVIIDSKKRRLNYASAGHNPMILYRASKEKTYYLNPHGFPIGLSLPDKNLFRNTIESDTLSMAEGDILLIYTDGITEAMNRKRQLYGEERFLNVIREHGQLPVHDFVQKLHEELLSYTEGTPQSDDITMVAIKEKSTAEKIELDRAKKVYTQLQQGKTIKEACEEIGLSAYAYYSKYKEVFEKSGLEGAEFLGEAESIEAKHLSIEEKTKLYDVIMRYPEYGAKKISEELNTERYSFLEINPSKIYEELVRAHLNTKELREAFVNRGGRKRRPKPPGTPMLTLDGRVIIQRGGLESMAPERMSPPPARVRPPRGQTPAPETEKEEGKQPTPLEALLMARPEGPIKPAYHGRDLLTIDADELLATPLADLFDKRHPGWTARPEEESLEEFDEEALENKVTERVPLSPQDDIAIILEQPHETLVDETVLESAEAAAEKAEDFPAVRDERIHKPPLQDELDFAAIIEGGVGLEDPAARRTGESLFAEPEAAKPERKSEPKPKAKAEEEIGKTVPWLEDIEASLAAPFDAFLEMDEEQGLINESGELDTDIAEQILQNEIQERLKESSLSTSPSEPAWDVVTMEQPAAAGPEATEENAALLNFDDLVDLLSDDSDVARTAVVKTAAPRRETGPRPADRPMVTMPVQENRERKEAGRREAIRRAMQLVQEAQYERAIQIYKGLLAEHRNDPEIRMLLAFAYFRAHRYRDSAQEYEWVLRSEPQNVAAHEKLGIVYASQGDFIKAIQQWEKLLSITPDRQDIRDSIQRAKKYITRA